MSEKDEKSLKWDIKVTSKGQITLPKKVRDIMMVREGDRLEAVVQDDTLMLKLSDDIPESERAKLSARRQLYKMGIDPDVPHPDLDHTSVRKRMPNLPFTMAERVRREREGGNEQ